MTTTKFTPTANNQIHINQNQNRPKHPHPHPLPNTHTHSQTPTATGKQPINTHTHNHKTPINTNHTANRRDHIVPLHQPSPREVVKRGKEV